MTQWRTALAVVLVASSSGCLLDAPNDRLTFTGTNQDDVDHRLRVRITYETADATMPLHESNTTIPANTTRSFDAGQRPCETTDAAGDLVVHVQNLDNESQVTASDTWHGDSCGAQRILLFIEASGMEIRFAFA